ncbi:hypothetical protein SprV_0602049200 [Sparganum proliferum]
MEMYWFTTRVTACNPSKEKSSNEIKPLDELPANARQRPRNAVNQRVSQAVDYLMGHVPLLTYNKTDGKGVATFLTIFVHVTPTGTFCESLNKTLSSDMEKFECQLSFPLITLQFFKQASILMRNEYRVTVRDGFSCDLPEVNANAIVITRNTSDSNAIVEVKTLEFPNIGRHFAKNVTCAIRSPHPIWLKGAISEITHATSQAFANIPLLQCKIEVLKKVSGEDRGSINY